MKKTLLSMLFFAIGIGAIKAQITVTNTVFPAPGDIFETVTVQGLSSVIVTAGGANQTWDLSGMTGMYSSYTVTAASASSSAALFPTADVLIPEVSGIVGSAFIDIQGNTMKTVGIKGTIDGFVTDFPVKMNPARIELTTPMNYQDTASSTYAFIAALDPHDPPGTAIDSIITDLETAAGGIITIDSIRILFTVNRFSEVDAWGNLTTPAGSFDVIRLKNREYTDAALQVKISVFGFPNLFWQDPSDPNGLNVDPSTLPFVGQDTIYGYEYWNDNEKQPILRVNTQKDGTTPTYAAYKASSTSTKGFEVNAGNIKAYPNPAFDDFTIEMNDFENGEYTVRLFNLLGKKMREKTYRVNGNTKIEVNVNDFKSGTYIYQIANDKGENIATRRIIIMKP